MELHLSVLLAIVIVGMICDIKAHRIPNWLVASGIVFALLYHATSPSGGGAAFALGGLGTGLVALMPLYLLRTMGAGDVKLMGMVGAFLGTAEVVSAILATLVAGGVLALVATAYKRMLPQLVSNLRTILIQRHLRQMGWAVAEDTLAPPSVGKLPYAIAIAAGTAVHIFILRN